MDCRPDEPHLERDCGEPDPDHRDRIPLFPPVSRARATTSHRPPERAAGLASRARVQDAVVQDAVVQDAVVQDSGAGRGGTATGQRAALSVSVASRSADDIARPVR
jgi:hypothetical protein